jgi:hypothetical protein
LNRNNAQAIVLDPEGNFLECVKYFLEPLSDGSLPAYNIQRDIFTAISRLPIDQEALSASGIGRVVLFYTKSKKPELSIKRMAEKLLVEWSRPILRRTDDYKQRHVETRDFDFKFVPFCPPPLDFVLTENLGLPSSAKLLVPLNTPSRNVQLPHNRHYATLNVSASSHLLMTATVARASRACRRPTPSPRRAHLMNRLGTLIIALLVQGAMRLSAK